MGALNETAVRAFVLSVVPLACASAPPAAPPPPVATSAPVVEAPPPAPSRVSLGPGEILCGVDDGPVPIGRLDGPAGDDLRRRTEPSFLHVGIALAPREIAGRFMGEMMPEPPNPVIEPAKPEVKLGWTLGPGLATNPAFEERAHACGALLDVEDMGDRTYVVQTNPQVGPTASRADGDTSSSKFTTCFATALCALGPSGGGAPKDRSNVRLRAQITPAVFRGSVSISIADERQGTAAPSDRFRGHRFVASPPPRSPAAQAYAESLAQRIRPGAEACGRASPPDQSFDTTIVFTWGPRGKRLMPPARRPVPFVATFADCVAKAAELVLLRPPPGFNPDNRIPIVARVDILTPGRGPTPGNP